MPISAAIGAAGSIGSSLIGGLFSSSAADKQAEYQQQALALQQQIMQQQMQMFQQAQENYKPFIKTGKGAVLSLAQLYGLGGRGGGVPFGPEAMDAFRRSPDYEFARSEGMRALTFADSPLGLLGRSHLDTALRFNSGLATQNFGNYAGRLLSLAQLGAGSAAAAGSNATGQAGVLGGQGQIMGNTLGAIGQTQAAGILGQGAAVQNAFGGLTNILGQYNLMNRNNSSYLPNVSQFSGAPSIPNGYLPVGARGFNGWINPDYYPVG